MEAIALERFLSSGSGSGSGYGYGYGSGSGSGSGSGYGYGYGYGDGSGVTRLNGHLVSQIDGVATIIRSIRGNVAKGFIVGIDFSLKPCFIAKVNGFFAHGDSLAEAVRDAEAKAFEELDEDERIEQFIAFCDGKDSLTGQELFEWHGKLTGSCEAGRKAFVADKQIMLGEAYTFAEFGEIVKGVYGWETIQKAISTMEGK